MRFHSSADNGVGAPKSNCYLSARKPKAFIILPKSEGECYCQKEDTAKGKFLHVQYNY